MASYDLDSADGTQAISAASLPLPTGAATSANQATEISSLSSIDSKLTTTNASLSTIDAGIPAALGQTTMSASMPVTMASNQSAIPVSIQSVISGGDELATFVVQARDTATGNGKSMLSIFNDSNSTVKIKLRDLKICNVRNTAVTGTVSEFGLYRITGHSSGTSLTPASFDTTDSLNGSVTTRTGATISGEASTVLLHWDWSNDEWSQGASDVESFDHALQEVINLLRQEKQCKPITLRANEGVTIKHVNNSTVGLFDVVLVFTQETL